MRESDQPVLEPPALPLPLPPQLSAGIRRLSSPIDLDAAFVTSSDPPLFSSDDLPASSAENYRMPRQKRQVKRTWYEGLEPSSASATKRVRLYSQEDSEMRLRGAGTTWPGGAPTDKLSVPCDPDGDSGVFMSDDDVASSDYEEDIAEVYMEDGSFVDMGGDASWRARKKLSLQYLEDPGRLEGPIWPYWQRQPIDIGEYHMIQLEVVGKIGRAIDQGKREIDLSGLRLEEVRPSALRPLRYVTRHSKFVHYALDEKKRSYEPFDPRLHIYLSINMLEQIPSELYHIPSINVLSLLRNQITEILPGIRNLTNMVEFNIGSNHLKHLPWEMRAMVERKIQEQSLTSANVDVEEQPLKFTFHPNPFIRPMPSIWLVPADCTTEGRPGPSITLASANTTRATPRQCFSYRCSTPTAFLDLTGRSLPSSHPAPTEIEDYMLPISDPTSSPKQPDPSRRHRTPSLLELCLRSLSRSPYLPQAPFLMPKHTPPYLFNLVKRTFKLQQSGDQNCTICSKPFIVPRTEWIEWLGFDPSPSSSSSSFSQSSSDEDLETRPSPRKRAKLSSDIGMIVPFLRRGCSWACWEAREDAVLRGWRGGGPLAPSTFGYSSRHGDWLGRRKEQPSQSGPKDDSPEEIRAREKRRLRIPRDRRDDGASEVGRFSRETVGRTQGLLRQRWIHGEGPFGRGPGVR